VAHVCRPQLFITIDGTFLDRWSLGKVWFNFNFIDSIDDLLETWSAPNSTLRSSWEWKRPSKEWRVRAWDRRACAAPSKGVLGLPPWFLGQTPVHMSPA
jgi:hypothetical protein